MPDLYRDAVKQSLSDLLEQAEALVDARLTVIAAKHGTHDQSTHGRKRGGVVAGDRETTIAALESDLSSMKDYEQGHVISDSGEILLSRNGEARSITFTDEECELMRGATLTHNHPSGTSFSQEDINMARDWKMNEVRAVGVGSGYTYSMTRADTSKPWSNEWALRTEISIASEHVYAEAWKGINAGTLSKEDASQSHNHKLWTIVSSKPDLNLKYTRTTRP